MQVADRRRCFNTMGVVFESAVVIAV
jgi:hypothetical protein